MVSIRDGYIFRAAESLGSEELGWVGNRYGDAELTDRYRGTDLGILALRRWVGGVRGCRLGGWG